MTINQLSYIIRQTITDCFVILNNYVVLTINGVSVSAFQLMIGGIVISVFVGILAVFLRK